MDLGLLLKGTLFGVGAAAPVGPVNIEIIRRSLTLHPVCGAALGAGAVSADTLYLVLAFLGVGTAAQQWPGFALVLGLGGGGFLAWLGVMSLMGGLRREAAEKAFRESRENPGTDLGEPATPPHPAGTVPIAPNHLLRPRALVGHYVFGLLMTLLNPFTIAIWISFSGEVAIQAGGGMRALAPLMAGVIAGAGGWVVALTGTLAAARRFVGVKFFMAVNIVGGLCLLGFGLDRIIRTLGVL